jgi:hypothetical protein
VRFAVAPLQPLPESLHTVSCCVLKLLGKVGNSLRITVPVEVAKHINLKKSDTIEMWTDNNHIIIERKP